MMQVDDYDVFGVAKREQRYSNFFFFNDTATTEIYTLSLHDALPIFSSIVLETKRSMSQKKRTRADQVDDFASGDRKSTRLNSSHSQISYAVFCLKKKNLAPSGVPTTTSSAPAYRCSST